MLESGLVVGVLIALSGGAWAWTTLAPETLLVAGIFCVAGGLAFGLPSGLLYHVALHRSLARLGRLPRRWWLRPLALHPLVPPEDALAVLAWCRLGALGCAVAFLGCALFALGALRAWLAA
jgi:hypothetical protein